MADNDRNEKNKPLEKGTLHKMFHLAKIAAKKTLLQGADVAIVVGVIVGLIYVFVTVALALLEWVESERYEYFAAMLIAMWFGVNYIRAAIPTETQGRSAWKPNNGTVPMAAVVNAEYVNGEIDWDKDPKTLDWSLEASIPIKEWMPKS